MTIRIFIEFALATLICLPPVAFAHGGGLNAEGCHTNRKTGDYHCHGGQAAQQPRQSQNAASGASASRAAPPGNGGSPTCFTGPRGGTYTITKSGRKNYGGC